MSPMFRYCMLLAAAVLILSGCYNRPVRNLASDSALIKEGQSTKNDVLVFLGEPDDQQTVAKGVEKWLYKEKTATAMEKTPVFGKYLGTPGIGRVVVTFEGDLVVDCTFDAHDADDENWANDFSWQEKDK